MNTETLVRLFISPQEIQSIGLMAQQTLRTVTLLNFVILVRGTERQSKENHLFFFFV